MSSLTNYMRWLIRLKIEELGIRPNIIFTSVFRRFDHNTTLLGKCIPFSRGGSNHNKRNDTKPEINVRGSFS